MSIVPNGRLPTGAYASYANAIGATKPDPTNPANPIYRVRITYGGDQSPYDGDRSSLTTDIITVKCMLNSIVSDDACDHCTADIKDFYLHTTLDSPAYMWMPIAYIAHITSP
jgi:hypothetical protein